MPRPSAMQDTVHDTGTALRASHASQPSGQVLASLRYRLRSLRRMPLRAAHRQLLEGQKQQDAASRHLSFTFAVIALCARVAAADGPVTPLKYARFRESFPLQEGMCDKIRSLFALAARREDTPLSYYAGQMQYAFPDKPALLEVILDRLFRIATADSALSAASERVLADIAHALDIRARHYARLLAQYQHAAAPHLVLGVEKRAPKSAIRTRYRELMRLYHPDHHSAQQPSQDMALLLQLKSSEINAAYATLMARAA